MPPKHHNIFILVHNVYNVYLENYFYVFPTKECGLFIAQGMLDIANLNREAKFYQLLQQQKVRRQCYIKKKKKRKKRVKKHSF